MNQLFPAKKSIILLILIVSNSLHSQECIEIEGVIADAETELPLQYANIDLSNNHLGTISNKSGEFRFKLPIEFIDKKIVFSYLGYQSYVVPVKSCLGNYLRIKLSISPVSISTINVTYYYPQEVIQKALNSISDNYLEKSANFHAFYREEVCENDERVQFIEAIMEVYKGAYNDKKDKDRIRILKAREEAGLNESIFFNYLFFIDGPYEALSMDIAKYPKRFIKILQNSANFLNPKHFKHYDYESVEFSYENGQNTHYIINFRPKTRQALLSGQLVIDKLSFAFLSIEYYLTKDKQSHAQLIRFDSEKYINTQGFYTKALNYHCKASFKEFNDRFVFRNSKIDYSFLFINSNNKDTFKISNSIDFVVTKLDTQNVNRFKSHQSVWRNVSLTKQLGKYDPDFWENYNVIKALDIKKE